MKKNNLFTGLFYFISFLLTIISTPTMAVPLFTFSPLTPTTIQVANNGRAIVQYIVTNLSFKTHTLVMVPMNGITQVTNPGDCPNPFVLGGKQSCVLTLQVSGSQISSFITNGPLVCQQGANGDPNPLLCYRPSPINLLNVTLNQVPQLPTLYAGTQNGNVYYSVNNGLTWIATMPPAGGSIINSIVATSTILYAGAANGSVYSSFNNGATWASIATPAPGYAVNGLNVSADNKLYIASANGSVFSCALNGSNCLSSQPPAAGVAVNGVFATANALYAASANGNVYYSPNNGLTWAAINGQPDASPVNTVYVAANTLYIGTADEYVYTSASLTGGGTWTPYAQTAYSLFVNTNGSTVIAGTQGGYLFSLSTGNELGFITYTPINSVFLFE